MHKNHVFVFIVAIVACLGMGIVIANQRPESIDWHQGMIPLEVPVIGYWRVDGEPCTMAIIRTEYAGTIQYAKDAPIVEVPNPPEYWTYFPDGKKE